MIQDPQKQPKVGMKLMDNSLPILYPTQSFNFQKNVTYNLPLSQLTQFDMQTAEPQLRN